MPPTYSVEALHMATYLFNIFVLSLDKYRLFSLTEVKIALINPYLTISKEKGDLLIVELDLVLNATICIFSENLNINR